MQMVCNDCGVWFALDEINNMWIRCPICSSTNVRCSMAIEDMYKKRKELANEESKNG